MVKVDTCCYSVFVILNTLFQLIDNFPFTIHILLKKAFRYVSQTHLDQMHLGCQQRQL